MPDPRPIPSLRLGTYDQPAARPRPVRGNSASRRARLRRLGRIPIEAPSVPQPPGREESPETMAAIARVASRYRDMPPPTELTQLLRRESAGTRPSLRRRRSSSPIAEPVDDVGSGRRTRKRRRIDETPHPEPRQPIKYGYYGQVEPGRLQLELVSCDGGTHEDPRSPEGLGPQNILRHDKSVYCSERPCVNIVLRHADDTPFCLEKLHIVGPEHGFTAPVREGLVFIAMTMADLQSYLTTNVTAQRRHRTDEPPVWARRRERSIQHSPERLTLADALRDPEVNAALEAREENHANEADNVHDLASDEQESYYGNDFGFGRTDPEAHCDIPVLPSTDTSGSNTPHATNDTSNNTRALTLLSDEEPGPEDTSSPAWLDYRLQRLRMMRRRLAVEDWDREERWSGLNRLPFDASQRELRDTQTTNAENGMYNLSRLDALMARSRVRSASPATLPAHPAPPPPRNEETPTRGHPIMFDKETQTMSAQFDIKRGKHKVTMTFNPPLSGRFILLKLWSNGAPDGGKGNVDVQSVIAKGFGGGRFFPARDVR